MTFLNTACVLATFIAATANAFADPATPAGNACGLAFNESLMIYRGYEEADTAPLRQRLREKGYVIVDTPHATLARQNYRQPDFDTVMYRDASLRNDAPFVLERDMILYGDRETLAYHLAQRSTRCESVNYLGRDELWCGIKKLYHSPEAVMGWKEPDPLGGGPIVTPVEVSLKQALDLLDRLPDCGAAR